MYTWLSKYLWGLESVFIFILALDQAVAQLHVILWYWIENLFASVEVIGTWSPSLLSLKLIRISAPASGEASPLFLGQFALCVLSAKSQFNVTFQNSPHRRAKAPHSIPEQLIQSTRETLHRGRCEKSSNYPLQLKQSYSATRTAASFNVHVQLPGRSLASSVSRFYLHLISLEPNQSQW